MAFFLMTLFYEKLIICAVANCTIWQPDKFYIN